jgi:hypothetical protein
MGTFRFILTAILTFQLHLKVSHSEIIWVSDILLLMSTQLRVWLDS